MANAARRAAAKRIEFLLSTFLLLTTGELIALPPLILTPSSVIHVLLLQITAPIQRNSTSLTSMDTNQLLRYWSDVLVIVQDRNLHRLTLVPLSMFEQRPER